MNPVLLVAQSPGDCDTIYIRIAFFRQDNPLRTTPLLPTTKIVEGSEKYEENGRRAEGAIVVIVGGEEGEEKGGK